MCLLIENLPLDRYHPYRFNLIKFKSYGMLKNIFGSKMTRKTYFVFLLTKQKDTMNYCSETILCLIKTLYSDNPQ